MGCSIRILLNRLEISTNLFLKFAGIIASDHLHIGAYQFNLNEIGLQMAKWRRFLLQFPKLLAVVQPICAKFTGVVDDCHRDNLLRPKFERNRQLGGEAVMVENLRPSSLFRFQIRAMLPWLPSS